MDQALQDQYNEFVKQQSADTSEEQKIVRKKRATTHQQVQQPNSSQWEFGPMEKQWMEAYYPGAFLHPKVCQFLRGKNHN